MGLTETEKAAYAKDGFVAGVQAFSAEETAAIRAEIEALEAQHSAGASGRSLNHYFRVNGQLVIPLLAKLARTPAILEKVADVLGPNLLVWSVELFIKEPHTQSVVSWHQDITYWGMGETDEEVTAWVALSDVSVEAGCMRFIPGSHKNSIVDHADTFDEDNLLSRGQEIAGVDEAKSVHGPLKPGEMSFHHGRCFHASGPNQSNDRRIGLAIRYVTPEVRQADTGPDYAIPVRGVDMHQGWIPVAGASSLFHPDDLALYDQVLNHQSTTLAGNADGDVALYETAGGSA